MDQQSSGQCASRRYGWSCTIIPRLVCDCAHYFHILAYKMMSQHLLTYLIFLPVVAALVLLAVPSAYKSYYRWIALGVSAVQMAILLIIINRFEPTTGLQLKEHYSWINLSIGFTADYFVAIDGLSFPLVALSVFVLLIAVISS